MAAKFIRKTQRPVQYAVVVEYDGVLHRAATNQTHRLHSLKILHEAERARRGQFAAERFSIHGHFHFLRSDSGMVIIHKAVHLKFLGRVYSDSAIAIGKLQRLGNPDIPTTSTKSACPSASQQIDV